MQPVELARKLAKEMDDHKTVSVSRVYVPNEYTVYLSPADREQFEGYENSLQSELEEYVTEHAKREDYALLTAPRVLLETDDDLAVGEFGIVLMMGGNIPGKTRVMSVQIYDHVETLEYAQAHWLAGGLLAFSFAVLLALYAVQAGDRRRMNAA